jgi:hypothetical protein
VFRGTAFSQMQEFFFKEFPPDLHFHGMDEFLRLDGGRFLLRVSLGDGIYPIQNPVAEEVFPGKGASDDEGSGAYRDRR